MLDSTVFRRQDPPLPPCDWLTVSFEWLDRLRILGAPSSDLAAAVVMSLQPAMTSHQLTAEFFEAKFSGSPWMPGGEETVKLRIILLRLLEVLEGFGFTLYAGVNQENGSAGDVLVMRRPKGWDEKAPNLL